jgi:hypothetical protein
MNGKRMRLEKVVSPVKPSATVAPAAPARESNGAKVISFAEIKKDK